MNILGISGSPSVNSRTRWLVQLALQRLPGNANAEGIAAAAANGTFTEPIAQAASAAQTAPATRTATLAHDGHQRRLIDLRSLPAEALVTADFEHPALREAVDAVAAAQIVVVGTPIYKASFSGLLKLFLDVLPPDGLRGKTVLALASGGSPAHLLALDYALKPVLSVLGARDLLDGVYAVDTQMPRDPDGSYLPHPELLARLDRALA